MTPFDIDEFNKQEEDVYYEQYGIRVDIQNIGKNDRLLVKREKKELLRIHDGLVLKTCPVDLSDGSFTNVYDLTWNPEERTVYPAIHSSDTLFYLKNQIKHDTSIIALMSGSFFFLTDEADSHPKELPYNLCIRNNKVISLPIVDDPIIYTKNNKLHGAIPQAMGVMQIGNTRINWVGERSKMRAQVDGHAVLYNSRSSEIKKVRDPKTGLQIGILDSTRIRTPRHPGVYDIVVNRNKEDELYVSSIRKGGGTHYFEGLFILQVKSKSIHCKRNDKVMPLTLERFALPELKDAITVGKDVHDPFFRESVRRGRKDCRSLIAQDINNNFHFVIFDGSKYIPGFKGVSADDIDSYFSPTKFKWAFFLDGGGSSRQIHRFNGKLNYIANRFVVRKMEDGKFLWSWRKARPLASAVALHIKPSD